MVNFGAPSTIPSKFTDASPARIFHEHNASVTLMRSSREECAELGRVIAGKLRRSEDAENSVVVVVPLKGWSGIDCEEGKFEDAEADAALVRTLKEGLEGSRIKTVELDGNINDEHVAGTAAELLHGLIRQRPW